MSNSRTAPADQPALLNDNLISKLEGINALVKAETNPERKKRCIRLARDKIVSHIADIFKDFTMVIIDQEERRIYAPDAQLKIIDDFESVYLKLQEGIQSQRLDQLDDIHIFCELCFLKFSASYGLNTRKMLAKKDEQALPSIQSKTEMKNDVHEKERDDEDREKIRRIRKSNGFAEIGKALRAASIFRDGVSDLNELRELVTEYAIDPEKERLRDLMLQGRQIEDIKKILQKYNNEPALLRELFFEKGSVENNDAAEEKLLTNPETTRIHDGKSAWELMLWAHTYNTLFAPLREFLDIADPTREWARSQTSRSFYVSHNALYCAGQQQVIAWLEPSKDHNAAPKTTTRSEFLIFSPEPAVKNLFEAIKNGNVNMVRSLLENNRLDLNTVLSSDFFPVSPLSKVIDEIMQIKSYKKEAIQTAKLQDFFAILDLLIAYKADINNAIDGSGFHKPILRTYNIISREVNFELLRYLLKKGVNPNEQEGGTFTLLHLAVLGGKKNLNAIQLLLEYKADPTIKIMRGFYEGKNALTLAKARNEYEAVILIHEYRARQKSRQKSGAVIETHIPTKISRPRSIPF